MSPCAMGKCGPPFPLFSGRGSGKPAVCFLAQLYLLHLPRSRHGQLLDEDDVARDFVARDFAAAVLDDFGGGEIARWFDAHECDGDLAKTRVGKAHHRGGSNGWMAREVRLDF